MPKKIKIEKLQKTFHSIESFSPAYVPNPAIYYLVNPERTKTIIFILSKNRNQYLLKN